MDAFKELIELSRRLALRAPNRASIAERVARNARSDDRVWTDERKSLFSEFGDYYRRAARYLANSPNVDLTFNQFGLGDVDDFLRRFGDGYDVETFGEPAFFLIGTRDGTRALLRLSLRAALILLYSALGFDVERICSDARLRNDFKASTRAGTRLTELEISILETLGARLSTLAPQVLVSDDQEYSARYLGTDLRDARNELGDSLLYWERRSLVVSGETFPFFVLYGASKLFGDETLSTSSYVESAASSSGTLRATIACGTMSAKEWRALRPGDVIRTEIPASKLFDVYIDERLCFRARPGLLKGVHAVRITDVVDED